MNRDLINILGLIIIEYTKLQAQSANWRKTNTKQIR